MSVTFTRQVEQKLMDGRMKSFSTRFIADRHSLMGFIYGMVRDLSAAEDLFQEVWVRLHEAVERGDPIDDPARWCRGVAKNLILRYWRDHRTAKVVADSELLDLVEQAITEHKDDWQVRRQALQDCIGRLPERSRGLLQLKYEQGLSFAAMAQQLARSADSLKMALSRVRRLLAECVQRELGLKGPQV